MSRTELLRLVFAQIFLHATMTGLRLAAPLLALSKGYSAGAVGALIALFALSQIFLAIPAGKYADHHGVRRPMGFAVLAAAVALVLATAFPTIPVLCLGAMLTGAAAGITVIVLQRHIGRAATSNAQRKQFFSWLAIAPAISNFIGPFGAGLIIDHAGQASGDLLAYRICFAVLAVLPLLTWLLVMRVRELPFEPYDPKAAPTHAWDLLKSANFRYILFVNWLQSASWDIHSFLVPILGYERGLSASTIGTILGAFALAAALIRMALPVIAARYSEKRVIAASCIITVGVFAIYPMVSHAAEMVVCAIVLGASLGCVQPMVMSLLTQVTPAHRQGEALGIRLMFINASSFLMPMVAGSFGALIGVGAVFWVVASIVAVGTPVVGKIQLRDNEMPPEKNL
ncbi:MFS transporter [Lampropedia puyangensis]|uniref:MFS transporter n=1 Tax=Lampropedia puyangensis TaxID=1330072 RepID=A0A4S8EWL7_9BURK|nr:MFS transporter [Lampropedia puyangensis]THT98690.1 MFS transporter [Lampropedia puyangensis]